MLNFNSGGISILPFNHCENYEHEIYLIWILFLTFIILFDFQLYVRTLDCNKIHASELVLELPHNISNICNQRTWNPLLLRNHLWHCLKRCCQSKLTVNINNRWKFKTTYFIFFINYKGLFLYNNIRRRPLVTIRLNNIRARYIKSNKYLTIYQAQSPTSNSQNILP